MSERVHDTHDHNATDGTEGDRRDGHEHVDSPALADLEAARDRFERATQRIEDHGGDAVHEAAAAYRDADELLTGYVDRATGTGRENFKAYVELEGKFSTLVENLPDDLKGRAAFDDALDAIDKRRLSESDFERAHDALEPAAQYAELLDEREAAREAIDDARTAAAKRRREIERQISEHERLLELGTADLDAPVEQLRDPVEAYNDAIREAFTEYRLETPAREVFALVDRSRWYPFVGFRQPPADLKAYVEESSDGEYSIPKLLEFAGYSHSKLEHYVEDADVLKRRVATQQTYLDGIDAEALTIDWPPEPAGALERRVREYRPFVARVADEETVAQLREIRLRTYDDEYDRLQTAAQAVEQLTAEEREQLANGALADDLDSLRAEKAALESALDVDDPV
ncbi:DUF7118 family protein [Natrialba sp. SSL1]|uniref:DUF7118 family protein n=1 Tax=Natrialba sp. SSL1 TaxID=1869245 RepID=UPI0008F89675|nr:hypothetical protein [Natrialba sp. SSL1]OIB55498.1 hypothetical protein BBD46_04105 [Natrialba sp. SSL1]